MPTVCGVTSWTVVEVGGNALPLLLARNLGFRAGEQ
jgi:hypothetical protein